MKKILGGILAGCTMIILYAVLVERYIVRYPVHELSFEELPAEFDGFRIAVVSDLHMGLFMPRWWCARVLREAAEKKPDAIVCLGDYVRARNTVDELREAWPLVEALEAPYGVFCVNGNHDHWADHRLALSLLEKSGRSVRLRHALISREGAAIVIAGTGDYLEDDSSVDRALNRAPRGLFTMVLTHNPDAVEQAYSSRVDLFLCGHTHGGQVTVPFAGYAPLVPVKHKKYAAGLKMNSRGAAVFVSRGIGWSVLPVRFNTFPEVPIVVLRKGKR